jgi:hypothetical protein
MALESLSCHPFIRKTNHHLLCKLRCLAAAVVVGLSACSGAIKLDKVTIVEPDAMTPQAIYIKPVAIEFANRWIKDHKKLNSANDIEALGSRYSDVLTRALERALATHGYTVTEHSANALIAELAITEMRITAPDFQGALVKLFSRNEHGSGDFTLRLMSSDKPVAEFNDHRKILAGFPSQLTPTNRVINQHAFIRELERFVNEALKESGENHNLELSH